MVESPINPRFKRVYAIMRFDKYSGIDVPIENRLVVKKIVFNRDEAAAEVKRLNDLNADKPCYYFSLLSRIDKDALEKACKSDIHVKPARDVSRG